MRTYNVSGPILGTWETMDNGPNFHGACIYWKWPVLVGERSSLWYSRYRRKHCWLLSLIKCPRKFLFEEEVIFGFFSFFELDCQAPSHHSPWAGASLSMEKIEVEGNCMSLIRLTSVSHLSSWLKIFSCSSKTLQNQDQILVLTKSLLALVAEIWKGGCMPWCFVELRIMKFFLWELNV